VLSAFQEDRGLEIRSGLLTSATVRVGGVSMGLLAPSFGDDVSVVAGGQFGQERIHHTR
jgi:hypothetical protein